MLHIKLNNCPTSGQFSIAGTKSVHTVDLADSLKQALYGAKLPQITAATKLIVMQASTRLTDDTMLIIKIESPCPSTHWPREDRQKLARAVLNTASSALPGYTIQVSISSSFNSDTGIFLEKE